MCFRRRKKETEYNHLDNQEYYDFIEKDLQETKEKLEEAELKIKDFDRKIKEVKKDIFNNAEKELVKQIDKLSLEDNPVVTAVTKVFISVLKDILKETKEK